MDEDFVAIRAGLQFLQSIPIEPSNLAAQSHRHRLNPPLTEENVHKFETEHGIALPPDYRAFLIQVGNGGAGPANGLEMLGQWHGVAWSDIPGLVGNLALPFPYVEAWNGKPIDATLPVQEQYQQQDEYWSCRHVAGAIPICDHGCNLRECLVITGPERGHIWFDDRADWQGLYPHDTAGRDRLTFIQWYRLWLDDCLIKARSRNAE